MKPGTVYPGMPMLRPRTPRTARPAHHRIQAPPGTLFSGGVMRRPRAARKAGHAKPARKIRGLSPGDVQCCAAEALAASLRLAGSAVSDSDVLALYRHTADGPDAGASIAATLEAAYRFGLAGVRPVLYGMAGRDSNPQTPAAFWLSRSADSYLPPPAPDSATAPGHPFGQSSALILGLDLPEGPHTVLDDGTAWWSWGQPYDPASFPDAVIEEAWAVTWT